MYKISIYRTKNTFVVRPVSRRIQLKKVDRTLAIISTGKRGIQGETGPQGIQGPQGEQGEQGIPGESGTELLEANGKGFINHGATASTARPTGFASIEWYGSTEPENAHLGDTWIETT